MKTRKSLAECIGMRRYGRSLVATLLALSRPNSIMLSWEPRITTTEESVFDRLYFFFVFYIVVSSLLKREQEEKIFSFDFMRLSFSSNRPISALPLDAQINTQRERETLGILCTTFFCFFTPSLSFFFLICFFTLIQKEHLYLCSVLSSSLLCAMDLDELKKWKKAATKIALNEVYVVDLFVYVELCVIFLQLDGRCFHITTTTANITSCFSCACTLKFIP